MPLDFQFTEHSLPSKFQKAACGIWGVANGIQKIQGLGNFCSNLEISEAFWMSLEISDFWPRGLGVSDFWFFLANGVHLNHYKIVYLIKNER